MQSNRFYFHTQNIKHFKKLGYPYFVFESGDEFVFTQVHSLVITEPILILSTDELDLSVLNGFRQSNIFCFCEDGCCGKQIGHFDLINNFFSNNISLSNDGLQQVSYESSFGYYIRDLFFQWILATNYGEYIIHGCEDESIRVFSFSTKRIKFFGLPKYNDKTILFKSLNPGEEKAFNKICDKTYNGLLKYEDFKYIEMVIDAPMSSSEFDSNFVNDSTTILFEVNGSVTVRHGKVASNVLCVYYMDTFNSSLLLEGFRSEVVILEHESNSDFLTLLNSDLKHWFYQVKRTVISNLTPNMSLRSVSQRALIIHENMFSAIKRFQYIECINIAIFVTDVSNVKHWKAKPLTNVIGTVANYDVALSYGFEIGYHNRKRSYTIDGYTDILVTSTDMYNYGYNFIPVSKFETLVYPTRYMGEGVFMHPCDYRKTLIGVFTDVNSDANIQNSFTSATYDLKSVTPFILKKLSIDSDSIYKDRFLFLRSHLRKLEFRVADMWSLGYMKKDKSLPYSESNITFIDTSGHFINFMIKCNYLNCDIKGHLNMVKHNMERNPVNSLYFSIDVFKFSHLSKFINPETREIGNEDALWHTREETLSGLFYAKIIIKQLKQTKSFDELVNKIENEVRSYHEIDGAVGLTVAHDNHNVTRLLVDILGKLI